MEKDQEKTNESLLTELSTLLNRNHGPNPVSGEYLVHYILGEMVDKFFDPGPGSSALCQLISYVSNTAIFQGHNFCQNMEASKMMALTIWCLNRLIGIRLGSCRSPDNLTEAATALLNCLQRRYVSAGYLRLVQIVLSTFIDTLDALDQYVDGKDIHIELVNFYLPTTSLEVENTSIQLVFGPLKITSIEGAYNFGSFICDIIREMVPPIYSYLPSKVTALFRSLCFAVELGDPILKQHGLDSLRVALDQGPISNNPQLADYFLWTVLNCTETALSGVFSSAEPSYDLSSQLQHRQPLKIILSLTKLLDTLVSGILNRKDFLGEDTQQHVFYIFQSLSEFLVGLSATSNASLLPLIGALRRCLGRLLPIIQQENTILDTTALFLHTLKAQTTSNSLHDIVNLLAACMTRDFKPPAPKVDKRKLQRFQSHTTANSILMKVVRKELQLLIARITSKHNPPPSISLDMIWHLFALWDASVQSLEILHSSQLDQNSDNNIGRHVSKHQPLTSWYDLMTDSLLLEGIRGTLNLASSSHFNNAEEGIVALGLCVDIVTSTLLAVELQIIQVSSQLQSLLKRCIVLLSAHWLMKIPSNRHEDISSLISKEDTTHLNELTSKSTPTILNHCLFGLIILPESVCPEWRLQIFRYVIENGNEQQIILLLHWIPLFVHFTQAKFIQDINAIVSGMTEQSLTGLVQEALVKCCGALVCAQSKSTLLYRQPFLGVAEDHSYPPNSTLCIDVRCKLCDQQSADFDVNSSSEKHPLDLEMFIKLFRTLLQNPDSSTQSKQACILAANRLAHHVTWSCGSSLVRKLIRCILPCTQDDNYQTRSLTAQLLADLFKALVQEEGDWLHIQTEIFNHLSDALDTDISLVTETLMITYGQIGKHVAKSFLPNIVVKLCAGVLNKDNSITGVSYVQLRKLVEFCEIKLTHLFKASKEEMAKLIIDKKELSLDSMCLALGRSFEMTKEEFFKEMVTPLFIALVLRGGPQSHHHIKELVKEVTWIIADSDYVSRLTQLCVLPETFVYFYTRIPTSDQVKHEKFLEEHFAMPVERIARLNDVTRLIHLFILHLAQHYSEVYSGLRWIALDVLRVERNSKTVFRAAELAAFLNRYLCGILANFDSKLLDDSTIEEKKMAMDSLMCFIKLIGEKYVTRMRAKFMATLKIALRYKNKDFLSHTCASWDAFIKTLDVVTLGTMLSEVGATLLSLHKDCPLEIVAIFRYIVIEKGEVLNNSLSELHFLPSSDDFYDCRERIKRAYSSDLGSHLLACITSIEHENSLVRGLGLKSLIATLDSRLPELAEGLQQLAGPSSTAPVANKKLERQLIDRLVACLLNGCQKDSSRSMRLLYARSLGLLGPLDPGRFCLTAADEKLNSREDTKTAQQSSTVFVDDRLYSFAVLNELGKVYIRSTNPKQLDSTALAIQELLKIYDVSRSVVDCVDRQQHASSSSKHRRTHANGASDQANLESGPNLQGEQLWTMFPEQIREMFVPLLDARYAVEAFTDWTTVKGPIFTRRKGVNYEDWIRLWAGSLNAYIRSQPAFQVFQNCEAVTKSDMEFATFMLNHAALQVLLDGDPQGVANLSLEVRTVLSRVSEAPGTTTIQPAEDTPLSTNTNANNQGDIAAVLPPPDETGEESCGATFDRAAPGGGNHTIRRHAWYPLAAQTVVSLLDHIQFWLQKKRRSLLDKDTSRQSFSNVEQQDKALEEKDNAYGNVKRFLESIPHDLQAQASFRCGSMARALQHWELAYRVSLKETAEGASVTSSFVCGEHQRRVQEALDGMLHAYAGLHEDDGLAGILAITQKCDSSTTLRTMELENMGRLELASTVYEQMLIQRIESTAKEPDIRNHADQELLNLYEGLFRCQMWDVGRLSGLIDRVSTLIHDQPSWSRPLATYRVQAAWKLAQWDQLDAALTTEKTLRDWPIGIGKIFLTLKKQDPSRFLYLVDELRLSQMGPLCAAAMEKGSYERAYEDIARLGVLTEMEMLAAVGGFTAKQGEHLTSSQLRQPLTSIMEVLQSRLRLSSPAYHTTEPALAVRHSLLTLCLLEASGQQDSAATERRRFLEDSLAEGWLRRGKVARKAGQYMASYTCILQAESRKMPEAMIERAKLLWVQGKNEEAQRCLDKGIPELFGDLKRYQKNNIDERERRLCAQALLLRARYSEETSRFDFDTICKLFEEVCSITMTSEEAHFRLARYLDRTRVHVHKYKDVLLIRALEQYGTALTCGSQFIYQSMPRLLTLWLDFGAEAAKNPQQTHSSTLKTVQEMMTINITRIPAFQYYTALSQILSRLCHEHPGVVATLIELIIRIFVTYPQQTIWFLMGLQDSGIKQRKEKCMQVLEKIKTRKRSLSKFIDDTILVCKHLRMLCSFKDINTNNQRVHQLSKIIPTFARLIKSSDFSDILIPLHYQLIPSLPSLEGSNIDVHTPFPSQGVHLAGIKDTVEVLQSLTRPKKTFWHGTDGRNYIIVCKPQDDLRRDGRLMELNAMINKFLMKNPETRRRQLLIRTYAVIPLSEKGGLLEWVNNTEGFRNILLKLFREIGKGSNINKVKEEAPSIEDSLEVKRHKFVHRLMPMFPVVLHQWFLKNFPDPSSWYSARQRFGRTNAVMSMVGYVLGLGDRHGENILLDSTTGDAVHVDFNCVFNHGRTFLWPEVVPFRLTRNVVDGLGATGVEGVFRRCCEATMRLLRHEVDPMMAVFRPMYFDSVLEEGRDDAFGKKVKNSSSTASKSTTGYLDEQVNLAQEKLKNMEDRLLGKMTDRGQFNQLPLSIEGQVDALINEATDIDRLCKMFVGWAAFF